jgi:ABC-type amino acid transport system permease subunit
VDVALDGARGQRESLGHLTDGEAAGEQHDHLTLPASGYACYLCEHLYMTLRRVFAGVVIGVVFGVLFGLLMGSIKWVRSVLEPWLTFLRALRTAPTRQRFLARGLWC